MTEPVVKRPLHPIHPGEVLADELEALDMTAAELARQLHVPSNRLYQLIAGKRAMAADTALRLEQWLGVEAAFWLNLQKSYELDLATEHAALGISEIVDENMANAARVHAIESGKDLRSRTLIAFGGAAPLHAARVAEKLGIGHVLVPANAGVGSAIGLLRAPVAYEVVRGRLIRLSAFDASAANRLFSEMRLEAEAIVRRGAPDAGLTERRSAFMRYRGQGHEIGVQLPVREFSAADKATLTQLFETAYRRLYSRPIPGIEIEILSWVLTLSAPSEGELAKSAATKSHKPKPDGHRPVFDPGTGEFLEVPIFWRPDLEPGAELTGPAVIAEDETSTVISPLFGARIDRFGYIELTRRED